MRDFIDQDVKFSVGDLPWPVGDFCLDSWAPRLVVMSWDAINLFVFCLSGGLSTPIQKFYRGA